MQLKTFKILSKALFILAAAAALSLTSCTHYGDDDDQNQGGNKPGGGSNPDDPEIVDPNPVEVNALVLMVNNPQYNIDNIDYTADGLITSRGSWRFVNLEKVNNIGDLKTIPWRTWASSAHVRAGDGLVAYNPKFGFWTMYIDHEAVDQSGRPSYIGVIYRKDFNGCDQTLTLDASELDFDFDGGEEYLKLTNKTFTSYQAMSDQSWCKVELNSSQRVDFVPDRIKVTVEPNESIEARIANVIVSTIWGKNTIVSVVQLGTPDQE